MAVEHPPPAPDTLPGGYERRDVRLKPLAVGGAILLLSYALAFALVYGLLGHFARREARRSPAPNPLAQQLGPRVPPEPRLQSAPLDDFVQMRAQEDAELTTYGWVDRQAGIVHIPIDRAMELLAQRGLPARPSAADSGGGQ